MTCTAMQTIGGGKAMNVEETKINVCGTPQLNALRFKVMMLRKGIAAKKLHKMAVDLHLGIRRIIKFVGLGKYEIKSCSCCMKNTEKSLGFMEYEFSCSSAAMVKRRASLLSYNGQKNHGRKWDQRFLMATMPCIAKEAESVINSIIPKFIEFEEDYFEPFQRYSSASSCLSTSSDLLLEIDRHAEEFIASFYNEMRLQRQDSFSKHRDLLNRGSH